MFFLWSFYFKHLVHFIFAHKIEKCLQNLKKRFLNIYTVNNFTLNIME